MLIIDFKMKSIGLSFSLIIVSLIFCDLLYASEDDDDQSVRIYRSPEERREAGLDTELTEWLKFSGLLEVEKEYSEDNLKNSRKIREYGNTTPNLQFGLEMEFTDWLGAELEFEAEYDGIEQSAGWDEAYFYLDFEELGLGVEIGRLSPPFGEFYGYFISDPLLEFAETNRDAVVIEYSLIDSFEVSLFAINSKTEKRDKNTEFDWGASIEYVSESESFRLGLSYLSDLSESDERFLRDEGYIYEDRVSAWNAHALIGFEKFEATAEIVQANNRFREFDPEEDKPMAYNIELAYFPSSNIQFAIRYEGSDEISEEPKEQYGLSVTWIPLNRMNFTVEYLHGRYKNNYVFDDEDIEFEDIDQFAAQFVVEF